MLSFAATVNVLLLILPFVLSRSLVAVGEPANATTLRLNDPSVTFSSGWKTATFEGNGSQFAFADGLKEEVRIELPENTTDVSYQGFKVAGGGLYLACINCVRDILGLNLIAVDAIVVDAHDAKENGTQPPTTLFSFHNLDPTRHHNLSVINLVDLRFNGTSQITFESVVVNVDPGDGNSTASDNVTIIHGLPLSTVAVTATTATSASPPTTAPPAQTPPPNTSGNTATVSSTSVPREPETSTANAPPPTATSFPQSPTSTAGRGGRTEIPSQPPTAGAGSSTTSTESPGSELPSPTDSQTGGTIDTSTTSAGRGTSGTAAGTSTPNGPSPQPTTGASSTTSTSEDPTQPSASPIDGTSVPANNGPASTSGVSKPVIIAVAVVASLLVLALLGAVLFVLLRNQAAARRRADPEGFAGLMKEGASTATISAPVGIPPRPQNPFADPGPPNVLLNAFADATDDVDVEDVLAQPEPRPPPPAMPKPAESPLRGSFARPSPWLTRIPRSSNSPGPL